MADSFSFDVTNDEKCPVILEAKFYMLEKMRSEFETVTPQMLSDMLDCV